MFKKRCMIAALFAAVLVLSALPGWAQETQKQPVSKSMTECTVIFQVYGLMAKNQGKSEEVIGYFDKAAARFRDAAITRAAEEGVTDPKQHVSDTYNELLPKWREKYTAITQGTMVELTTETKDIVDWVNYCGSLGRKIKILPLEKEK